MCEDCPFEVNTPESLEGFQAWDIAVRISPQIRSSFPLSEALSLASALGYDMAVMGELLPALSTGITKALMAHKE